MSPALPGPFDRAADLLGAAVEAVGERSRGALAPVRRRVNRAALRSSIRGEHGARDGHLRIAGALGGGATVGAILLGMADVVVSPVVWDVALWVWFALELALVGANGYWRGGLAAAYALAFAPILGGAVGVAAIQSFTGFGFGQTVGVLAGIVLVPPVHGVGASVRRARETLT